MSKIKTCKTHTALTAAEPDCKTQGLECRAGERAGFLGSRVDSYGGEVPEVEFQSVGVQRLQLQTQRISEQISNQDRILEEGRAVYR